MAQYQITLSDNILHDLFSKDEGVSQLLEQVLNQLLQAEVTEYLQAELYERTPERRGQRNGYKSRNFTTRVGTLELAIPQVREGQFSTELFGRYQRNEKALVLALMEMWVNGVSTRKVRRITEELCGTTFSKSTVSHLCGQLDAIVEVWNNRSLSDKVYPFLIVDALVLKIRHDGRVHPHSALIVTGISGSGHREILGVRVANSESQTSWADLFTWLKRRGLKGVELVVSDHHEGLVGAVLRHFQGASWQRCQTHLTRNILDACPKRLRGELRGRLRTLFTAPDVVTARELLGKILEDFEVRTPKAMETLENGFEDALAVLALPEPYRKRLRTTNSIERLNQEIRRRERVIRIFPNQASAERLLGAVLMEQHEEWVTGRRYFDMEQYWEWRHSQGQHGDRSSPAMVACG